jgi:hypothetical protein
MTWIPAVSVALMTMCGPTVHAAEDRFLAAEGNGRQAQAALVAAQAFLLHWAEYTAGETTLIAAPRDRGVWTVRAAGQLYPLLGAAARLTDRELFDDLITRMPSEEAALTARLLRLPDDYDLSAGKHVTPSADPERIALLSAAYAHEGLAPMSDIAGQGPWTDRLVALVDDLFTLATVETPFSDGPLPSGSAEINGHLLCVLPRLAVWTGDEKYLTWARRIGDAYCGGVLPGNRGLPASRWDFGSGKATNAGLSLDATGAPIVAGLVGLYALEASIGSSRQEAYARPLANMLDILLARATTPEGQFYARIEPNRRDGYSVDRKNRTDDWPRLLSAVLTFGRISGNEAYIRAVSRALDALPAAYASVWRSRPDRLAGSLPGVLHLLSRMRDDRPVRTAQIEAWVDDRIVELLQQSTPSRGSAAESNLIRASLAYAWHKSAGLRVSPWTEQIRCGAYVVGDTAWVAISTDEPWEGQVIFDVRNGDWADQDEPPCQAYPTSFPIYPEAEYGIRIVGAGGRAIWTGSLLEGGLSADLAPGHPVYVQLHLAPPAPLPTRTDTLTIDPQGMAE